MLYVCACVCSVVHVSSAFADSLLFLSLSNSLFLLRARHSVRFCCAFDFHRGRSYLLATSLDCISFFNAQNIRYPIE